MNHNDPRVEYPDLFKLPVDERLQLVAELWDSIAEEKKHDTTPVSEAVALELRERLAHYEAHPESALTWEEVQRQARED